MRHTLEGGTDAAEMVLYDPAGLPEGFDEKVRDEPVELLEELAKAGRVCWIKTEGDGAYSLGVFLGEDLPAEMREFAKRVEAADVLHVPGGRLVFAGVEYAFREDDAFLRKYPHMGATAEVPPGVYGFELFEIEYPEGFHTRVLRDRLSAAQYRVYTLAQAIIPIGCVVTIAVALSPLALGFKLWAMTALPVGALVWALWAVLASKQEVVAARDARAAIEKEFPDYAAILRTAPTT